MSHTKIDRPVFHRHPSNPVLTAADFPTRMRAVYNSSAIKMQDGKYVMLCRSNQLNHKTLLWGADSDDGIAWKLRDEPFAMPTDELWQAAARSVYYDPRITFIDGKYIVLLAVEGDQGCRVAMFESADLQSLSFVNFINVPINRNMVIFPDRHTDGRYMRLERPAQNAAGKGNIWLSFSPDLIHWGDSHEILKTTELWNYAISGLGPSTVPIRIDHPDGGDGWLFVFHSIMNNCTTREYAAGAAILSAAEPWRVTHVTKHPILFPEADYEMIGLVEHVVFPCATILEPDGELKLYYGAADTVQCVATAKLDDVIHACVNW